MNYKVLTPLIFHNNKYKFEYRKNFHVIFLVQLHINSSLKDLYPQSIIKNGLANNCFWGFIQQENTVFSKQLYDKVGGINRKFKMAGDFDLWKRFAKYEKLISIPIGIAVHRKWVGQLTNLDYYYYEINKKKCLFNFFYPLRFLLSIIFALKIFLLRTMKRS